MFYAVFIIKTQTREAFFSFPEMYTLIVFLTRSFGPHDNSIIPVYALLNLCFCNNCTYIVIAVFVVTVGAVVTTAGKLGQTRCDKTS